MEVSLEEPEKDKCRPMGGGPAKEAQTGVMLSEAKKCQDHQKVEGAREGHLEPSERMWPLDSKLGE